MNKNIIVPNMGTSEDFPVDCLFRHFQMNATAPGAIIGFSFGALIGILAAVADRRLKAAVLAAVAPSMSEFWRTSLHPEVVRIRNGLPQLTVTHYADMTRSMDAIELLGRRNDLQLFLQFASGDEFILETDMRKFSPFVGGNNLLRIYKSDSHWAMFWNADARRDRLAWVAGKSSHGDVVLG